MTWYVDLFTPSQKLRKESTMLVSRRGVQGSLRLAYWHFFELRFAAAANAVPRLNVRDVADVAVILNLVKLAVVDSIQPLNYEVPGGSDSPYQLQLLMKEALILQCAKDVRRLAGKLVVFLAGLKGWLVTGKRVQIASNYQRHLSSLRGKRSANARHQNQENQQHAQN
jgi:hypothetical protein